MTFGNFGDFWLLQIESTFSNTAAKVGASLSNFQYPTLQLHNSAPVEMDMTTSEITVTYACLRRLLR